MKCLSVLKRLSVKLQKRDLDVYEAYNNGNNFTDDLQGIRDNIKDISTKWFDLAVTTAANIGVLPSTILHFWLLVLSSLNAIVYQLR